MKKRRWTLKLTLALLAGAVVTWAVAWGCALWAPHALSDRGVGCDQAWRPWPTSVPAPWQSPQDFVSAPIQQEHFRVTNCWSRFEAWIAWAPEGERSYLQESYGWPAMSLHGTSIDLFPAVKRKYTEADYLLDRVPDRSTRKPLHDSWWKLPRRLGRWLGPEAWRLPAGVHAFGFTLNTLLAAAVVLTLTESAGAWRRRARRKAGKCPWCGYDRAGIVGGEACPECGRGA